MTENLFFINSLCCIDPKRKYTGKMHTNVKGLTVYCLFHLTWFGAHLPREF